MNENFKKLASLFDKAAKLSSQIERYYTDTEEYKMLRHSLDETLSQISVLMSRVRDYEYQNK